MHQNQKLIFTGHCKEETDHRMGVSIPGKTLIYRLQKEFSQCSKGTYNFQKKLNNVFERTLFREDIWVANKQKKRNSTVEIDKGKPHFLTTHISQNCCWGGRAGGGEGRSTQRQVLVRIWINGNPKRIAGHKANGYSTLKPSLAFLTQLNIHLPYNQQPHFRNSVMRKENSCAYRDLNATVSIKFIYNQQTLGTIQLSLVNR